MKKTLLIAALLLGCEEQNKDKKQEPNAENIDFKSLKDKVAVAVNKKVNVLVNEEPLPAEPTAKTMTNDGKKDHKNKKISCKDACQRYFQDPRDKEAKFVQPFYDESGRPAMDDCYEAAILEAQTPQEHGCPERAVESCASACEKHKSETKKKVGK